MISAASPLFLSWWNRDSVLFDQRWPEITPFAHIEEALHGQHVSALYLPKKTLGLSDKPRPCKRIE